MLYYYYFGWNNEIHKRIWRRWELMLLPKLEQPSTRLFWKNKLNFCVVFHDKIPLFILCNFEKGLKAEIRILTNGFFVSMQKSRNVWAPCSICTYSELKMEKLYPVKTKKTRETKCSFNFTKKLEICFFPNFSSLYGIFFYTLLTLSEVRCLVSLVVATV